MMATWTLTKEFRFEASHVLRHHDGKCARLHGHSWVLVVGYVGTRLIADGPKQGMVCDYADIKRLMKPIVEEYLDHHHLNDTVDDDAPTSERVAQFVYQLLKDQNAEPAFVEVRETCTSSCTYSESGDA
jgi:6-pyruvoyltetrahydropterin/6-carboxytetrahydropterin synthase